MKKSTIILEQPKPFDNLDDGFKIAGWVPSSWLERGNNKQVKYYILDVDGTIRVGHDIDFKADKTQEVDGKYWFSAVARLSFLSVDWIQESHGRVILQLKGKSNPLSLYVPIIINEFKTDKKIDPEIIDKHTHLGERILKYYEERDIYYRKLNKIKKDTFHKINLTSNQESDIEINVQNEKISEYILEEIKNSLDLKIALYNKAKQNREESILDEEYKEVLEQGGGLYRGGLMLALSTFVISFVLPWTFRHIMEDLDNKLWDKVKEIAKKAFTTVKNKLFRKKQIPLVINGDPIKNIIFIFDTSMTVEEFEDAFMKAKYLLLSLDQPKLYEHNRLKLVFIFNKSKKEWKRTKKELIKFKFG